MKWILLGLTSVTDYGFLNYDLGSVTVHKPGSPTARQHLSRKFITNTYRHWYLYDPSWWIMSNSPTATGDTTTVKNKSLTKTNCQHERNTPHLTTHVTQQIPMLFDFISRATRIYEHAWHLLSRKESFIIISQAMQHAVPTSYAVLLLITHAQPQASTAQHPSYSHHYQNRNWAHVYGFWGGEGRASSTQFQLLSLGGTYIQVATVWECGATRDSVFIYFRLLRSRNVKSTDEKILAIGLRMTRKEAAVVALVVLLKHMFGGL